MCWYTWRTKTPTSLFVAAHGGDFFLVLWVLTGQRGLILLRAVPGENSTSPPCLKPSANSLLEQASCCRRVARARLTVSDKRLSMLHRNLQSSAQGAPLWFTHGTVCGGYVALTRMRSLGFGLIPGERYWLLIFCVDIWYLYIYNLTILISHKAFRSLNLSSQRQTQQWSCLRLANSWVSVATASFGKPF